MSAKTKLHNNSHTSAQADQFFNTKATIIGKFIAMSNNIVSAQDIHLLKLFNLHVVEPALAGTDLL